MNGNNHIKNAAFPATKVFAQRSPILRFLKARPGRGGHDVCHHLYEWSKYEWSKLGALPVPRVNQAFIDSWGEVAWKVIEPR